MERKQVGVETVHPEFVPVVFADDRKSAAFLKELLERHNIVVIIDDERTEEEPYTVLPRGVPVLVPEEMHDRASEIVAAQEESLRTTDSAKSNEDYDDEDEEFEDDDEEYEDDFDDEDFDDLDDEYEDEEEEDEEEFEDFDEDE